MLIATLGIVVGLACLGLVAAYIDVQDAQRSLAATEARWLVAALACFWGSIAARIIRWRRLMHHFAPLGRGQVSEALIVGYAMNYVLPARLGEPFRAEYVQRRFGIDRFAVFGSIVTERVLDGLSVVVVLIAGLVLAAVLPQTADLAGLHLAAATGLLLFGGAAALLFAARGVRVERLPGPRWVARSLRRVLDGASTLPRSEIGRVLGWTALTWIAEALTVWALLTSLGVGATVPQLMVLLGATALTVPIPSAPGYVGTLQLVYVVVMSLVGLPGAVGAAAATLFQAIFFGSLIASAGAILVSRWLRAVVGVTAS